jgi:membrane-associated phospholipid phosphatase
VSSPVRRFAQHVRSLWPRYALLPVAPFVLWCAYCLLRGEQRWELVVLLIGVPALAYTNTATKRLYGALLPFGLVGLIYDAMRFVKHVGVSVERVHVCDLRAYETTLFGSNGRTLHDWLQPRAVPALDLLFAIPYGTYLLAPIGYAVYLYFRDYPGAQRVAWTFLVLNVVGFIAHHAYPAAPPWYFHAHGCGVDLATAGNPGPNLLRVDAMLGVPFFTGLYGRSNDVFGALPSLHVSYPIIMLMEGWPKHGRFARALLVAFAISMCGAAVYLDHHWVLDVVAGLVLGVIAYSVVRSLQASRLALPLERGLAIGESSVASSTRR